VIEVLVRPLAQADLDDAFIWYEERAPGLGHEFLRAVAVVLERIARHPELYPEVYRGRRRALIRRFPYAVYYRLDVDRASIVAGLHVKRHPRTWRDKP
jgi:toxin ParE1/3/4